MAPHEFDNVKAEKAIAMRRYRRQRKFKWMFELCIALFLASQSSAWFPIVSEFIGGISQQLAAFLNRPFYVFLLFNAMIFIVYALSVREKRDGNKARCRADLYDEFIKNSESRWGIAADYNTPVPLETPNELIHDKQIACLTNAASPVNDRTITIVSNAKGPVSPIHSDSAPAITDNVSDTIRYRRARSAKFERRISEKPRRKFRRSETEIHMKMVRYGGEAAEKSRSVEELNDDEFKNTVEAFIAAQKWVQMEEFKEEQKSYRMALTLSC